MTMIEKMARAISLELARQLHAQPAPGREWDPTSWTATGSSFDLTGVARAALSVLLEPSEGMLQAAWGAVPEKFYATEAPGCVAGMLKAAIQAALDEAPGSAAPRAETDNEIQRLRQVIEAWREAYIKATGSDQ